MLTEKTFTVNDFSMNYAEGPQAGAPLVFLHGATLWWKDFEPLQLLTQRWHVSACDMRGHGKSSRTPGKYRAIDFSADIVAFVRKQIREPVVLVGHSNGGTLSLLTAAQIPELVQGVILLDPSVCFRDTTLQSIPLLNDWFVGMVDILNANHSVKEVVAPFMPDLDEVGLQEVESMIRSVDPEFIYMMGNNQFFDDLDLEQMANKVKCPTLLLYGETDLRGIVRDRDVEFIKEHIPQTVAHQIKGAGHSPHWDQTETTLEHINNFLKTI